MDKLARIISREMERRGLDSGRFAGSSRYCVRLFDQMPELLIDDVFGAPSWPSDLLQNETMPTKWRDTIEGAEDDLVRLVALVNLASGEKKQRTGRPENELTRPRAHHAMKVVAGGGLTWKEGLKKYQTENPDDLDVTLNIYRKAFERIFPPK